MTDSGRQNQRAGNHSQNFQTGTLNLHQGMSYSEVREVVRDTALSIFRENVLSLGHIAARAAESRATELIDEFVEKLSARNPNGAAAMTEPDMQYALFSAAQDYARTKSDEHREMLTSLLVEKTKFDNSVSLESIALSEAIEAVRKISGTGADTLTALLVFSGMRYSIHTGYATYDLLMDYFKGSYLGEVIKASQSSAVHDSLAHAGCIRVNTAGKWMPIKCITKVNPAAFQMPLLRDEQNGPLIDGLVTGGYAEITLQEPPITARLTIQDPEDAENIAMHIGQSGRGSEIEELVNHNMIPDHELRAKLISSDQRFAQVFDLFETPPLAHTQLTNVGVAVAHANYSRVYGEVPPLSNWIDE